VIKPPKINVVIPTYNGADFLLDTLMSVQNQDFHDWQATIVVDGSTDNTVELFRESAFSQDVRFELITKENKGVSHSRNVGVRSCDSEFVAFLDHDDIWHPSKLFEQITFMEKHPNYSACMCWYLTSRKVGGHYSYKQIFSYDNFDKMMENWLTLKGNGPLMPSTMLVRRAQLEHFFSNTLNAIGDLEFTAKLSLVSDIGILKKPLVLYVQHEKQMHKNLSSIADYLVYYSNIPKGVVVKYSLDVELLKIRVRNHLRFVGFIDEFLRTRNLRSRLRILMSSDLWQLSILSLVVGIVRKRTSGYTARLFHWRMINKLWN
jgi:glycosyltransferase involved in cell wall biosynthesis